MNILVVNSLLKELYIAVHDSLKVFNLDYNSEVLLSHVISLPQRHGIPSQINFLKLFISYSEYLLVVLTHSSLIFIFFPENWERAPLKLDNYDSRFEDNSLWSCSMHEKYLAVGSNTHEITVWDLETLTKHKVAGHSHNIPCLDYNKNGYIVSTSIDSGVIVTCPNGLSLSCKPCIEWGWGVKWIPRKGVFEVNKFPKAPLNNLSGRYKSNLPTHYFHQIPEARGNFDITNFHQYLSDLERRLNGVPFVNRNYNDFDSSDSEENQFESSDDMLLDQVEGVLEDFNDFLIVQTTKNTVHLIDPGLANSNENRQMHVLAAYIPAMQFGNNNNSRLSMIEYIEKFSLCVIANQFAKDLMFLRIVKRKDSHSVIGWEYSFLLEMKIVVDGEIIGINLIEKEYTGILYVLTKGMMLYVFKITKNEIEKLTDIKI